jgi:branched-chain amino acid transport system ATP-binding protein
MLELHNVRSFYGHIEAIRGVSLRVPEGQIVSLLGANGAGKTTTLRTIVGLNRSADNDIKFKGQPIGRVPAHRMVSLGMTLVPERREVFPDMTVADNLEMGAYSVTDQSQVHVRLEWIHSLFPVLVERAKQKAGTLSGGQQQMLAIGRALMSHPSMLLLDEPTLGLAPLVVRDIFRILKLLNEQGITILLVEQNATQALELASYAYILENGRVMLEGPSSELRRNPQVQEAYLGGI